VAADDARAINQVLQQSAADWSRGDLAAFMRSYEDFPSTEFVTPGGLLQGYSAIKAHYAARYGTGQNMGALQLTILDERGLSPAYALVTGRFTLAGPTTAHGIFTLVFHKTPAGWRITYDHTS
jgi:uncharacterized protein (TIGR02246 family)